MKKQLKQAYLLGSLELVKEGNLKIKQESLLMIFILGKINDKKNKKKDNIIDFPNKLSSVEKEIEAIILLQQNH